MRTPLRLLVLVITLVLGCLPSLADRPLPDGKWWQTLTDEQRTLVTMGAMVAYSEGYFWANLEAETQDHAAIKAHKTTWLYKGSLRRAEFTHGYDYYKERITGFYQTHPGAMRASVADIISCLADLPIRTCNQVAADYEYAH